MSTPPGIAFPDYHATLEEDGGTLGDTGCRHVPSVSVQGQQQQHAQSSAVRRD
ncbi:hypothetical protein PG990_006351 [Apiospora arundinis]|uniref:Uncharacterized protein n=1 Tax=Apiospora arundinis TaxID=335852 RepID=A0ABR2J9X2_9PEZI